MAGVVGAKLGLDWLMMVPWIVCVECHHVSDHPNSG